MGRYFVPLAERLAPHVGVYAIDLPGFGESGKPDRVHGRPVSSTELVVVAPTPEWRKPRPG